MAHTIFVLNEYKNRIRIRIRGLICSENRIESSALFSIHLVPVHTVYILGLLSHVRLLHQQHSTFQWGYNYSANAPNYVHDDGLTLQPSL